MPAGWSKDGEQFTPARLQSMLDKSWRNVSDAENHGQDVKAGSSPFVDQSMRRVKPLVTTPDSASREFQLSVLD